MRQNRSRFGSQGKQAWIKDRVRQFKRSAKKRTKLVLLPRASKASHCGHIISTRIHIYIYISRRASYYGL